MPELASTYSPSATEPAVLQTWLERKAFHAEPDGAGDPYSVVIPPPNVTAALHLGHALNNTLQDVLIRAARMQGKNTLWMPGTDHAGIATQSVVDKRLQAQGEKSLKDYKQDERNGQGGRDAFIGKVQAWKDEYEQRITEQLEAMGASCDWDRQRFTMDPQCARAVREAFFQLFADGLIYRGKRLVNWDPVSQTALADDEVEMEDVNGSFWYMQYPVCDADGHATGATVTVATTRPETMLGDTAVAVNPTDAPERSGLIGQFVKLPIAGRIIPIVGDDYVVKPNPEGDDPKAKMASGFLKVTPAHDPNDWAIGQRHNLAAINVMAPDASISLEHGWAEHEPTQKDNGILKPFLGLSCEDARKAIVRHFRENGLLDEDFGKDGVAPHRHAVGHSYRSHVPVEPYLSDQWYVKVTDERLAGAALRSQVEDQRKPSEGCVWKEGDTFGGRASDVSGNTMAEGGLRFYPERYARTFQSWHENIRDWCISRQLWWGHRIPVWSLTNHDQVDNADELVLHENLKQLIELRSAGRVAIQFPEGEDDGHFDLENAFVCVRDDNDAEALNILENLGLTQDPDVLDTWFSSALWPLSTLGWPEKTLELDTWNPTSVLCTAREIITLWVSRMVMFNQYFLGRLPFKDVFIHAMIQDGHGQKMSKSLGNGVDPFDIIHSHGADAMRFTLCSMTTDTQDVRMPVDCVDPHTGEMFVPKFITASGGVKVAAPIQEHGGKQCVSSYGLASGQATPSDDIPAARNTSEKFELGKRFSNKLWNGLRFALSQLEGVSFDTAAPFEPGLAENWILRRLELTLRSADTALAEYRFADLATCLYDFFWRDLCDWYIEAVKPTLKDSPTQQRTLATCLDAALRLLHPLMPFITERLWDTFRETIPADLRGVPGLELTDSDLLVKAAWPLLAGTLGTDQAETRFERLRAVTGALRELRTHNKVPPRERKDASIQAPESIAADLEPVRELLETFANVNLTALAAQVDKPKDAATAVAQGCSCYLHGVLDAEEEKKRLGKKQAELTRAIGGFKGKLGNDKYVNNAPAALVEETRQKLAEAEAELAAIETQLAEL